MVKHAGVINEWLKEVSDDPVNACCSCERLFKRANVTFVEVGGPKWVSELWQVLFAYIQGGEKCDDDYFVCGYCRALLNDNKMPSRCVLNGLETVPIPPELAGMDPLSCQLIQRAKAFQTIIRLGTYTGKVPSYNSLKACKGTMFFLPLPVGKTLETLHSIEDGQTQSLPDPELYIILNGKPTKNKVVWQKLVDVNRVKKAFHKLKEINWLYKDIDDDSVGESAKKVIEVCDSAIGEMIEKVTPRDVAGFQARQLDPKISPKCDIDHYKLLNVDEDAINSR